MWMKPIPGEYVDVICNETMYSVGQGRLVFSGRTHIVIESVRVVQGRQGTFQRYYDARVHHFEGYEPPRLKVKIDGKIQLKDEEEVSESKLLVRYRNILGEQKVVCTELVRNHHGKISIRDHKGKTIRGFSSKNLLSVSPIK